VVRGQPHTVELLLFARPTFYRSLTMEMEIDITDQYDLRLIGRRKLKFASLMKKGVSDDVQTPA
jgi:hypothetical protein